MIEMATVPGAVCLNLLPVIRTSAEERYTVTADWVVGLPTHNTH